MRAKRNKSKSSKLHRKQGKALTAKNGGSSQGRLNESANLGFRDVKLRPSASDMARIDWNELLGREAFRVDLDSVRHVVAGKVVLVTGAAGSIGSELCRQILQCKPAKLVCLDHSETDLFYLQMGFGRKQGRTAIVYCVADFSHSDSVRNVFLVHQVQVVFHAAGYKHVPMMEENPRAALENNVFGLIQFLDVCERGGCEAFVLISSDKAVNPTSVMGCTKRLGELILAWRHFGSMRCISVRFGNVIGSRGSVVPVFLKQIAEEKSLTVTHREVARLFITAGKAVSLLLQALAIGERGDILVLEMGEPVRIVDLARVLIRRFGGFRGRKRSGITFTGLRPGEKLHEELFYEYEQVLPTSCERIKRASGTVLRWPQLESQLDALRALLYKIDDHELRAQIQSIIPEYRFEPVNGKTRVPAGAMRLATGRKTGSQNELLSSLIGQVVATEGKVLTTEAP